MRCSTAHAVILATVFVLASLTASSPPEALRSNAPFPPTSAVQASREILHSLAIAAAVEVSSQGNASSLPPHLSVGLEAAAAVACRGFHGSQCSATLSLMYSTTTLATLEAGSRSLPDSPYGRR